MSQGADRNVYQPITVRFSPGALAAIQDMAHDYCVSQAQIVRMAVAGNMAKYLGDVRYVDQEQAKEIKRLVVELLDVTSDVRNELNRIGVNYNQEVRAANAAAKYGGSADGNGNTALPAQEMDRLMSRYEAAARQAGKELYRILS